MRERGRRKHEGGDRGGRDKQREVGERKGGRMEGWVGTVEEEHTGRNKVNKRARDEKGEG